MNVAEAAPMSYDSLLDTLRMERRSNKLLDLPNGFWNDLRGYLRALEEEFRTEQEKDPFSRRVRMLTDQVTHARDAADALWSLRERKVSMQALAHIREKGEPKNMQQTERVLYDKVLGVLHEVREELFAGTVAKPGQAKPTSRPPGVRPGTQPQAAKPMPVDPIAPPQPAAESEPSQPEAAPDPRPPPVPDEEPPTPSAQPATGSETVTVPSDRRGADGMITIRATGEIPPFVGPDMQTYRLQDGDLATVPDSIAKLLVRRGKAAVVEEALA